MTHPDQRILDFIREHHILTLAVARDNIPYCATCYYAWQKEFSRFILTSDPDTRHVKDVTEGGNYRVAGTVALETRLVGKIRGIQFTGTLALPTREEQDQVKSAYLKRFPVARLMPHLHLWILTPDFIKLTDNRLGFGTKLLWHSENLP